MAQPPAKRQRMMVSVGGGGEAAPTPPSPGSRKLRQTLLAVLFLVSMRKTVTASLSQIGRMVHRHVDLAFHKYHGAISSKLESFQMQIEGLRQEVKQLARLCSYRQADRPTRLEPNHEHASANESNTNIRLRFLNDLKTPIYTDKNITAANNAAIKIGMFEGDKMIESGPLSKVKVEILVLRGDFCNDGQDNWTEEDFNKYIAQGRNGQGFVLGGDRTVWLNNGQATLSQIRFKEGSSRTRSRKFIMGARVCNSKKTSIRIQEAVMKPVTVLDRRNEANEKRHPPMLDDDVYRLEEIAKDGVYHTRLQKADIITVQDFLKALNKDANKLREILQMKKQHNSWEKMVRHARECFLEDRHELKPYKDEEGNVVLFDCVHDLVGAEIDGRYIAPDKFNPVQQAIVDKLKEREYDQLDVPPFDHIMEGGFPVPNFMNANAGEGPSSFMSGASQPDHSAYHAAHQVRGIEEDDGLSHVPIESSFANANSDPCSSIPDHRSTHNYQDQGTQPSSQEQFSLASLTGSHQYPLGRLNSSYRTTEGFYSGAGAGAEDNELALRNQAYAISQPHLVAPGFDQEEIQSQLFFHGDHSDITLTPEQLTFHGAPGGPAQVSMQSQRQEPLPSNGRLVSEASTSTRNQSNLAPPQGSQCHGSYSDDFECCYQE